jgi:hypothetical protein
MENLKRGGSLKLPKMPKASKKGKLSKSYSKSLEATNRLFTENNLFEKPKSRKRKIFDPNANYAEGGDTDGCPEGYVFYNGQCVLWEEPNIIDTPNNTGYNAANFSIQRNSNNPIEQNDWWKEHEKFHHLQNLAGGMSTSGQLGMRPNPYVASSASMNAYYDRRNSEKENEINKMIQGNPNLQFIPRNKLNESIFPVEGEGPSFVGAEDLIYMNPTTVEGEARIAEENFEKTGRSMFPEKQKGGEAACPPGYTKVNGQCKKINAFVTSDPDEYAFRKAAYDDSLWLHQNNLKPLNTRGIVGYGLARDQLKKYDVTTKKGSVKDLGAIYEKYKKSYPNRHENFRNVNVTSPYENKAQLLAEKLGIDHPIADFDHVDYSIARFHDRGIPNPLTGDVIKTFDIPFTSDASRNWYLNVAARYKKPVQPVLFQELPKPIKKSYPPIIKKPVTKIKPQVEEKTFIEQPQPPTQDNYPPVPTISIPPGPPPPPPFNGVEPFIEGNPIPEYATPDPGAEWVPQQERYVDWNGNNISYKLPRFRKPGHSGPLIKGSKTHYLRYPSIETRNSADIIPEEEFAMGGQYIEAELTDKEIDDYRKGGFIVEDISVPSLNQYPDGGEPKGRRKERYVPGTYDDKETAGYELTEQEVNVPVKASAWGKAINAYEKNNSEENFIEKKKKQYLKKNKGLNEQFGVDMQNFPKDVEANFRKDYDYKRNTAVVKKVGRQEGWNPNKRTQYVDNLNDTQRGIVAESKYGSKLQPTYWSRTLAGLGTLASKFSPEVRDAMNKGYMPGLTKKESQEILNSKMTKVPFTNVDLPFAIPIGGLESLAGLEIPGVLPANYVKNTGLSTGSNYKEMPSWYNGEKMANVKDKDVTAFNPLTYAGLEAIPQLGVNAVKSGYNALKASKEAGLLSNAYKLNPLANKLNTYNRVVGQDAILDLQNSGLIRAGERGGVETNMGVRTSAYPSFGKGAPRQAYIDQTIQQGKKPFVISTNRSMKASNLGRHGKGSTMFPVDETGKYMSAFSADDVKVFGAKPHWLKGYPEVPKELPGSPNSFKSEINWANWNRDTPNHPELMSEYNTIEETTKANGTWMKNPDGTNYNGTPEQFIQEQSSYYKKAYPEGIDITYRGVTPSTSKYDLTSPAPGLGTPDRSIFTANKDLASGYANTGSRSKILSSTDAEGTPGVFELMHKKGNQIDHNAQLDHWLEVNLGKSMSKPNLIARIAEKERHLERLRGIENVEPALINGTEDVINMLKNYLNNYDDIRTNHEAMAVMKRDLGDVTSTNDIAEYLPGTDLDKIKLRNIDDGGYGDVTIVNSRPGNYMKSRVGNVGFFDLNNPNIYKMAIPGIVGGSLMYGKQKDGGMVLELSDKEIEEYKKGGWIVEEM